MRWSQALIPTQKETPADAVAPSHILLLRAGMIRPLGAGAYTFLPLGLRVLQKASQIVREEMNAAGAIEIHMPALQPMEIWQESGRDKTMGGILMQFKLSDRPFTLGPTHEEVITDLARDLFKSYKQLPITLYQIQTKFRNEPRPRFGLLRTREFLMKDAYSFDADVAQLSRSYDAMYEAYCRVFDRCGLPYVAVEAESGPIGGDASHEFMVPCATGEDTVILCEGCGYAANREKAEIGAGTASSPAPPADAPAFQAVPTPGKKTIEEVTSFLKTKPDHAVKLLVFMADGKAVGVLVRGDHEANEAKVRRAFHASTLEPASPEQIEKATGAPMGFLGPVNSRLPLAIDRAVAEMSSVVVGGNEVDVHLTGVVPGRDFPLTNVQDLRSAGPGDPCPRCGEPLIENQGIEIGHVFKLGTKYSQAMGANFLDDKGQEHPIIMGCYGIGVSRILSAVVEACHDKDGIIWPLSLAPYQVLVAPLMPNHPEVMGTAERIVKTLEDHGVEVLLDDRDLRPGVKFKDADLIGIPLRVVVGERGLKEGTIEVKWRDEPSARTVPLASAPVAILEEVVARQQSKKDRCAERRSARSAAKEKTA